MYQGDNLNFLIIDKIEKENLSLTFFDRFLKHKFKLFSLLFFVIIFFLFNYLLFSDIKSLTFFEVSQGESITQIAKDLKNKKLIKSSILFPIIMKILGKQNIVIAGIYKFDNNDDTFSIARKISIGNYSVPLVKVTIPEGSSNQEIIDIFMEAFSFYNNQYGGVIHLDDFSNSSLSILFVDKDGFLFPDTYLFLPNITKSEVLKKIQNNFQDKIFLLFDKMNKDSSIKILTKDLKEIDFQDYFYKNSYLDINKKITLINQIGTTSISLKEIIIIGSFLEGEAKGEKDMRMISGILWNRLKIGMYLQIDAAMSTYKNKGLTKNPINNPGLIGLNSALNPIKTSYIYYLTDNDGIMRYARDYKTHLKNVNKYLRKN